MNLLTQAKNENKALQEKANAKISTLEGKLKWFEDSHTNLVAKAKE